MDELHVVFLESPTFGSPVRFWKDDQVAYTPNVTAVSGEGTDSRLLRVATADGTIYVGEVKPDSQKLSPPRPAGSSNGGNGYSSATAFSLSSA